VDASRRTEFLLVLVVAICAAAALLALAAAPADAFESWSHGGTRCSSCHDADGPDDTDCTTCHTGFASYPGRTCWSCHAPGQDTAPFASPSSACSQGCHLYYPPRKAYETPFTHGPDPHLGAVGWGFECLDCHGTSASIADPGGSPHHSGVATAAPTCQDCHDGSLPGVPAQASHDGADCTACHEGMNIPPVPATCHSCHTQDTFGTRDCRGCHADAVHDPAPSVGSCTSCHSGYQQHAGKISCTNCHTNEIKVHHLTVAVTTKSCRSCHAKTHAGRKVANSRCASCHRGTGTGPAARAYHSARVTRSKSCRACHSKGLHAAAYGSGITSCGRCHKSRFHARQARVTNSICLSCHPRARYHTVGYSCTVCHRRSRHDPTPSAS
jgi:hypothetical protein